MNESQPEDAAESFDPSNVSSEQMSAVNQALQPSPGSEPHPGKSTSNQNNSGKPPDGSSNDAQSPRPIGASPESSLPKIEGEEENAAPPKANGPPAAGSDPHPPGWVSANENDSANPSPENLEAASPPSPQPPGAGTSPGSSLGPGAREEDTAPPVANGPPAAGANTRPPGLGSSNGNDAANALKGDYRDASPPPPQQGGFSSPLDTSPNPPAQNSEASAGPSAQLPEDAQKKNPAPAAAPIPEQPKSPEPAQLDVSAASGSENAAGVTDDNSPGPDDIPDSPDKPGTGRDQPKDSSKGSHGPVNPILNPSPNHADDNVHYSGSRPGEANPNRSHQGPSAGVGSDGNPSGNNNSPAQQAPKNSFSVDVNGENFGVSDDGSMPQDSVATTVITDESGQVSTIAVFSNNNNALPTPVIDAITDNDSGIEKPPSSIGGESGEDPSENGLSPQQAAENGSSANNNDMDRNAPDDESMRQVAIVTTININGQDQVSTIATLINGGNNAAPTPNANTIPDEGSRTGQPPSSSVAAASGGGGGETGQDSGTSLPSGREEEEEGAAGGGASGGNASSSSSSPTPTSTNLPGSESELPSAASWREGLTLRSWRWRWLTLTVIHIYITSFFL